MNDNTKKTPAAASGNDTIDGLKQKYEDVKNIIRGILNGRVDKKDIRDEEKRELRGHYSHAAQMAFTLSQRCVDQDEIEKYADESRRLATRAKEYGSVMSSKIPTTTFDDVQGLENVKKLVKSFMFMAQNPQLLEYYHLQGGLGMLMYGAPGTGKTETVLQLARQTGRDLMQVNVAEIKSMWVGESEKNIKALFDRYRKMVKESEHAPILFFNEADAIINKRSENAERSVDKMENSMQNIILQEIENLDGILIATTNLTQNLDKAFERRFLYKIEFSKPSLEAKSMIWQSMIPELSTTDAQTLAQSYDFSGGQIENIARKQIVDNIITGVPLSIDKLRQHCDTELLDKKTIRRAIGF
jgi:SpoVK/Ycf46/Vps4 family AAA+-type ATPase